MWNAFKSFLRFLEGVILFYLLYKFVVWYIKGHFDRKWWWAFWTYDILPIVLLLVFTPYSYLFHNTMNYLVSLCSPDPSLYYLIHK